MVISARVRPLEVVETVVEAADLAWNAFELCHGHKESEASHQECAKLEAELARERSENQRLKAALEEYHKTILQFHQQQTAPGDNCRDAVASGIHQSPSENCPSDLYERLRNTVESPKFLEKLQNFHKNGKIATEDPLLMEIEGDMLVNINPEDPSWWLWVTDDMVPSKVEEPSGLDNEGYIIVSEEDIVEGIAVFMARYIVSNPQSEKMTPEQLQKTLSTAFASMNNRNVLKKLWDASKFMYTAATWGIALVGFYRHPFILRAAMKAVQASGRVLVRAL